MVPEERQSAEQACARLIAEYCLRVDEVSDRSVADLFTDDGMIENEGVRTAGREALLAMPRGSARGIFMRHVSSSAVVTVINPDHAEALSYFTAFLEPAGAATFRQPLAVGHYRDEFRRTPDGWRFSKRVIHTDLRRADHDPDPA